MSKEMLNIHYEVVICEVAEMLEKFPSQLEFCGQHKWHLCLEHIPSIKVDQFASMVPLNELFPHGEVLIVHGDHSQLNLYIHKPVHDLSLLLRIDVLESIDNESDESLHITVNDNGLQHLEDKRI